MAGLPPDGPAQRRLSGRSVEWIAEACENLTTLGAEVIVLGSTELPVLIDTLHPRIATPILEQARGTPIWEGMTELTPLGRLGRPEDIAAGVAYLASDDAAFITGLELYIDGGYMAR